MPSYLIIEARRAINCPAPLNPDRLALAFKPTFHLYFADTWLITMPQFKANDSRDILLN